MDSNRTMFKGLFWAAHDEFGGGGGGGKTRFEGLQTKFRRRGVPTRDSFSRQILNVHDLCQVEYRAEYRILANFLSIKPSFYLYVRHSPIIIWLWPINGRKHEYLGSIQLVFNSTSIRHISLKYRYSTRGRVEYWATIRPRIMAEYQKKNLNREAGWSYLPKFATNQECSHQSDMVSAGGMAFIRRRRRASSQL